MRHSSIGRLLAGMTVLAIVVIGTAAATTTRPAHAASPASNDAWLDRLTGKHRELFDAPAPNGGVPLVHLMNYYDTYNTAYGAADRDINGILTFYGATTFYGLNDAMWAKYRIGEFLETKDASGAPATANPWRTAPVALGLTLPRASVESLQKRGATFILCNNALTLFSGMLAEARHLPADQVYADLKANILPGVTLVPGMVVAIEKAQGRGIAYHRQ